MGLKRAFSSEFPSFSPDLLAEQVGGAREAVVITEADLNDGPKIVFVNKAFTRLTGYTLGEVYGKTPRLLQGPATERRLLDELRKNLTKGDSFHGELVNYRKDGTPFLMSMNIEPVRTQGTEITHFVAVLLNGNKERESRRQRERYRVLVEHNPGVVVFLDRNFRLVYINPAGEMLLGQESANLLGQEVRTLRYCPKNAQLRSELLTTIQAGISWRGCYELEYSVAGSCSHIDIEITPVFEETRISGYVVLAQNATERRRLEVIASNMSLSENVTRIFSGIRHEVGNPINSVKAALSVLREEHTSWSAEQTTDLIDAMLVELRRVETLLRDLRAFNTDESPNLVDVDLEVMIEDFSRLVRPDLERSETRLIVNCESDARLVHGDPGALQQVLLNLVTNSRDALQEHPPSVGMPTISILALRKGAYVHLIVADNGPGIFIADPDLIFTPFYTTKTKGSGLGLPICRKLVTAMNGTLDLEMHRGRGCRFVMRLESSTNPPPKRSWIPPRNYDR
jgi:PAS domain S-box-containing protein